MKGALKIALTVLGMAAVLLLSVVVVVFCIAFGWVWALLVLAGKRKLGPQNMWGDATARRDFRVRRIELKVAGGLLACYAAVTLLAAVMMLMPGPAPMTGGLTDWVIGSSFVVSFSTLIFIGMPLGLNWQYEWQRTGRLLEKRYVSPVLF